MKEKACPPPPCTKLMCWPCRDTTSLLFLSHISIYLLLEHERTRELRRPLALGPAPTYPLGEFGSFKIGAKRAANINSHANMAEGSWRYLQLNGTLWAAGWGSCSTIQFMPSLALSGLFPYHEMRKQGFLLTKASEFETNILRCAERRGLLCLQAAFTALFLQVATCHSDDRTVK